MSKQEFKLHQLLATVGSRDALSVKLIREAAHTFAQKTDHFDGRMKTYHPDDDKQDSIANETEQVQIITSVMDKLKFIQKPMINSVDTAIAKEETNSSGNAFAELTIDGVTYNLSATSLLALEKRITTVRGIYDVIPTLDPTKEWVWDAERECYTSNVIKRNRLVKKMTHVVVVPATDKFPAQVEKDVMDVSVGHYEEVFYSAKLPVKVKSEMLARIDSILDAISIARAKANQCNVIEKPIMKNLFSFIDGN